MKSTKNKISLQNDENNFSNTNTNYYNNNVTSNLHRDNNTLSPLNGDTPAGIIYSQNCDNFQKRKNA